MRLTRDDYRRIALRVINYGMNTQLVADQFNISRRRVQQIAKEYRETGKIPSPGKPGPKPKPNDKLRKEVISAKKKIGGGATVIGKYLRKRRKIRADNNRIHAILLEENMAKEEPGKKGRKKWVRYERSHSLSAVHMDWFFNEKYGRWVCAVLDDASRMILAAGEFDNATAESSIKLLDEAYRKYLHITPIREVITDHGSQFYANKRDKKGEAKHSFEEYCKQRGIKQTLCKYNHPQSNGKMEKWFDTYNRHRDDFDSIQEFVDWYNRIGPHMSLNFDELETPEQAFYKKCDDIIFGNFVLMMESLLEEEI